MAPLHPRTRRRGLLFVACVVVAVQIVAWRGSARLKAVSYAPKRGQRGGERMLVRRSIKDAKDYAPPMLAAPLFDKGKARLVEDVDAVHAQKTKHKKEKHSLTSTVSASTSAQHTSSSHATTSSEPECRPLPTNASPAEQCRHVRLACPPSGHIDYLQFYYCIGLDDDEQSGQKKQASPRATPAAQRRSAQSHGTLANTTRKDDDSDSSSPTGRQHALRAMALVCIITWMLFLFSWVGLVASDFFCPNLATIAARLGLSESTAGVTFLAFGNGSPDVFSTFGAMRTGSGSLAIGELIGAASFIVSVISGCMMLIAPFRVKRFPFLRDVGFFTMAVALTMTFLFDGKLLLSESIGLIALYVTYATTVIAGTWWQNRQHRARALLTATQQGFVPRTPSPVLGFNGTDMERQSSAQQARGASSPSWPPLSAVEYDPDVDPFAAWDPAQQQSAEFSSTRPNRLSPSHSPGQYVQDLPSSGSGDFNNRLSRFRAGIVARHSLLGAVEFRDVVRNLQSGSSIDHSEEVFQSRDPERFLPHEHRHTPHHQRHVSHANVGSFSPLPPQHRHRRNLSVTPLLRPEAAERQGEAHNLQRSHSLTGPTSSEIEEAAIEREEGAGLPTQPLSGVEDAVGDPWREHGQDDACNDAALLPSPVLPAESSQRANGSTAPGNPAQKQRPVLPRLTLRKPTGSSSAAAPGVVALDEPTSLLYNIKHSFRPTVKALFPSLRHLHQKSWFGIFIGFVTAPAILLLNLTLPVVDDATDQAYMTGEKSGKSQGQIRLEGDEADLNARIPHLSLTSDDEEDAGNGRNVIDLSSASVDGNPWNGSSSGTDRDTNRRDQLTLATALRRLPGDVSPLTEGTSPKSPNFAAEHTSGDAQSQCSESSDSSSDSHTGASRGSHTFLVVSQCAFAPPFCVWAFTSSTESDHVQAKTLSALVGGVVLAILVFFARARFRHIIEQQESQSVRRIIAASGWARVALGFLVSILYIMSIVDEVVSILQTLGIISGLSDAILGLTVFAVGNSLGDLVANITIARMGHPVMAVSACFAGPLLNLLLGIGISGTWLLSGSRAGASTTMSWASAQKGGLVESAMDVVANFKHHHDMAIYHIDVSPTLSVSGLGLLFILLGTLVAVPLNGFLLDRRIGMALITTYAVIMCTNVGVELYLMHQGSAQL